MSRKKLIKLLNKELEYTGTFEKIGNGGDNICITNVKHNGKTVTDHVWIGLSRESHGASVGDEVRFTATARTYKDTRGERKHGLSQCHDFRTNTKEYRDLSADDAAYFKKQGRRR